MDFETFYNGGSITYLGTDNVAYVAAVHTDKDFPSVRKCVITRADGQPIVVRGTSYPEGYVVGRGEVTIRNMHNEAVEHMIACKCDDYSPQRISKCRWDESKGYEWAMQFPPAGIYKSIDCRIAERCGVRYASHRKGYRASARAFSKFLAAYRNGFQPIAA